MNDTSKTTTDHATIRNWTESRGGRPAVVEVAGEGNGGILRIDFGESEERLEEISWDEFFRIFEENNLAFLYQNSIDGEVSRFSKFIERE